jgi:alanine racemase
MNEIHKLIPATTKVMGVVKANAYGHGDVEVAKALRACGVDFFGVSSIDEAIILRQAGIEDSIIVLGYTPPQHFHYLIQILLLYYLGSKHLNHRLRIRIPMDTW